MNKSETITIIKNIEVVIVTLVAFLFPILFLTNTTDSIILPKQLLVIFSTTILVILFSVRSIIEEKLSIKSTPFTVGVLLFSVSILLSSLFSRDFFDSLIQTMPIVVMFIFYFSTINSIDDLISFKTVEMALVLGGAASVLLALLQYFKIYIFPFELTQNDTFSTLGSILQHIIYSVPLFLIALSNTTFYLKHKKAAVQLGVFVASTIILGVGIVFLLLRYINLPQQAPILPHQYGFQIAFASISQDSTRLLQSFLFGSGYGTFSTDFTRFKPATYNLEPNIASALFTLSSSFVLELIATVGVCGLISFLFLFTKAFKSQKASHMPLFAGVLALFMLSFLLPFSFSTIFLLFFLLALFGVQLYLAGSENFYTITLSFVALKHGLLSFTTEQQQHKPHRALPILSSLVFVGLMLFVSYYSLQLFNSDTLFRSSLEPAAQKKITNAYDLQRSAISTFPYRSDYYRIFSQLNLGMANSILSQVPQGASPSASQQSTSVTLLQQAINSGRSAASIAPLSSLNWQSLAVVYRNLINIGPNADQFAIAALQQAISVDPTNPQLYIDLGGIFYQLGRYDDAASQFILAARLKPDLANAYYNLGHAFEAKGDLQNALAQYQAVKTLTQNNKQNQEQITKEIEKLSAKIGKTAATPETKAVLGTKQPNIQNTQPLEISTPAAQLPKKQIPISIPPPPSASQSSQ